MVGPDNFVEIEAWANEKLPWFRRALKLEHGTPSHDTFGRLSRSLVHLAEPELIYVNALAEFAGSKCSLWFCNYYKA
jgi:hypothetical protein